MAKIILRIYVFSYGADYHRRRLNYFSSDTGMTDSSQALGNEFNNNRRVIMENMARIARIGDERNQCNHGIGCTGWPKKNETFTLKPFTGFITGSIFLIFALK